METYSITQKQILNIVKEQLAIDYNCRVQDFNDEGIVFTIAQKLNGRRCLPFNSPRCEMITFGNSVIINASKDVMRFVKKRLINSKKYDPFNSKFVYGICYYYLPNLSTINSITINNTYKYEFVENDKIYALYKFKGFYNSLRYDINSQLPETLAVSVWDNNELIVVACASVDCKKMCQIGIDVLPKYGKKGVAKSAVNILTKEMLCRGYIPYYFTDSTNIASQKTAISCGYDLTWIHTFKNRLYKHPFNWLNNIVF